MKQPRNATIATVVVTLLLDSFGIGLVIPVLPELVTNFLDGDLVASSHYYGIFVAIYAAMQFVFAPILGSLSDRFGRRPVILISLLGAGLDYLLLAFAPDLSWLFVGRVISGVTGASFSAATAYIADVTPSDKRAQSFGLIGAAFGIGFIIGPAVGGLLGGIQLRLPFFIAAALNLLNFLYGVFMLPESLSQDNRRPFSLRRANPFSSLVNLGRHPFILGLTGTLVCIYLAQQIFISIWALYGADRFGWREVDVGVSLTVVGLSTALVQGGLIRVVMPKLRERRALMLGLVFSAIGLVGFGAATSGWMMYAIIFPFTLSGFAAPAIQSLVSREVSDSEQGEIQGSLGSLASLAAIVGPLIGTALFARFGTGAAVPRVPGVSFFAAASMSVIGLLLVMRLFARTPEAAPASSGASA